MADITLTASTRTNLLTTQRIDALSAQTNRRLATGLRVSRSTDSPIVYFMAKALTDEASDLMAIKDNIGQSLSVVGNAVSDIDYISSMINQMQAVANGAADQSADARAELAAQFDEIRSQLDTLAADSQFAGTNLIGAPPDSVPVTLNSDGSSLFTITGVASDSASLGIGTAAGTYNNFATDADVENAVFGLQEAFAALQTTSKTLGSNAGVLNTRLDYTQDLANTMESGGFRLTGADMNEEAANMLALNVSRQLAMSGLNFVNQSQQAIQQLF